MNTDVGLLTKIENFEQVNKYWRICSVCSKKEIKNIAYEMESLAKSNH